MIPIACKITNFSLYLSYSTVVGIMKDRGFWPQIRIARAIHTNQHRFVPSHQLQCLHHGATFVPLCAPILSSQPRKVTICGGHVMASVCDIKIAEALLMLCLAYSVMKRVWHCWNWGVMAFRYQDMERRFHNHIFRISVVAGWIAEMLFMLFFAV